MPTIRHITITRNMPADALAAQIYLLKEGSAFRKALRRIIEESHIPEAELDDPPALVKRREQINALRSLLNERIKLPMDSPFLQQEVYGSDASLYLFCQTILENHEASGWVDRRKAGVNFIGPLKTLMTQLKEGEIELYDSNLLKTLSESLEAKSDASIFKTRVDAISVATQAKIIEERALSATQFAEQNQLYQNLLSQMGELQEKYRIQATAIREAGGIEKLKCLAKYTGGAPIQEVAGAGKPPDHLCCPVTTTLMIDPVTAADGFTYDRAFIEAWFAKQGDTPNSPISGAPLQSKLLYPNRLIQDQVHEYLISIPVNASANSSFSSESKTHSDEHKSALPVPVHIPSHATFWSSSTHSPASSSSSGLSNNAS